MCTRGLSSGALETEKYSQTENLLESPVLRSRGENSEPGGRLLGARGAELTATGSVRGAVRGEGVQPWPQRQPVAPARAYPEVGTGPGRVRPGR